MTSFSAHRTFRNVILWRESLKKVSSIHFCSLIAPMMARKDLPGNLFIDFGLPGFFVFDRVVLPILVVDRAHRSPRAAV